MTYEERFAEHMDYARREIALVQRFKKDGRVIEGQYWLIIEELCRRLAKVESEPKT